MVNNLTPLIKWSGGKGSEIKLFSPHFPQSFERYIEPFVGGGAVFFHLNFNNNVISDTHKGLINFYQQIKIGNALNIYDIIIKFDNSEETYYYVRDNFEIKDNIDWAARFYFLRKTAFRGMLRYNRKGHFNIPWGRYMSLNFEDLKDKRYENILTNTEVCCLDFKEIFNLYNNENNFLFLDPPYDSTFKDYGYCQFGEEYQNELSNLFKSTKNKCLLIIGKSDLITDLYKDYIVGIYDKKYRFKIHSGRVGSEINNQHYIIKNY